MKPPLKRWLHPNDALGKSVAGIPPERELYEKLVARFTESVRAK